VVQTNQRIRRLRAGTHLDLTQQVNDCDAAFQPGMIESWRQEAKLTWIASLIESSDDAMISNSLKGIITSWNRGAQRIFGYTAIEAVGKPLAILVPNDHAHEVSAMLAKVAHGERVDHYEIKGITKAGGLLEVSIGASPVRDSGGTIIGASTIISDITARKRAEKTLHESETQYRVLFDSNPLPMWVFDRKSLAFLAVNEAAIRHYGFSRDEFADMTVLDIRPDADIPRLLKNLEQSTYGLQKAELWRHRKKDGSIIHVEITAHNLDFQGREAELVLVHDITDRQKAEERLRQSEERFSKAFRSSPFGVIIATVSEGRIVDANPAYLKMVGYAWEDVIGRTVGELNLWTDVQKRELMSQQSANEDPGKLFEVRFQARSGEVKLVQFATERIQLNDVPCVLAIIYDVTESRRLEQQLRQAQKMEAMGRLAGGIAHDFNNLLSIIIGYCELSQEYLDENQPLGKHVAQIKKAGERAASLTRQLLAFSRQQVLQPRTLSLNDVVNSISKMLLRVIGEDISLVFKPGEPLSSVRVDLGQVEQVLLNLTLNARDAMPEGGKIVIETADVKLDESHSPFQAEVVKPGSYVMLSVSDTGVGIDHAALPRIFEPFFTTKEPGRGTGLGLSTVYGIVKQSGGYIWVYSEPFRGTAVKLYLPGVDQPAESLVPSQAKISFPRGTETILLVEDDEALRKVTVSLLQSSGYKVLEAENAATAIDISRRYEGNIALLLSDVIMPGKSGPDLALDVKRQRPEIKLLYVSGYTGDMIAHQGVLDPGMTLLSKPFSKEALLTTVRSVLDAGADTPQPIAAASQHTDGGPAINEPAPENGGSAVGSILNTRKHVRFKLNVDLTVFSPTLGPVPANALDISESGLSAILPLHLPSGETVELDFRLPIRHLKVVAVVRQNHHFRYGFQFVEPDGATVRTIRESCSLLEKIDS
jgi:two-component system, cell cycle sensor histidine kinase and response regulator CckA